MRHLIRADFSVIACNSYSAPDKRPAKSAMYYDLPWSAHAGQELHEHGEAPKNDVLARSGKSSAILL